MPEAQRSSDGSEPRPGRADHRPETRSGQRLNGRTPAGTNRCWRYAPVLASSGVHPRTGCRSETKRLRPGGSVQRAVCRSRLLEAELAHPAPERRAADAEDARRLVAPPAAGLERGADARRVDRVGLGRARRSSGGAAAPGAPRRGRRGRRARRPPRRAGPRAGSSGPCTRRPRTRARSRARARCPATSARGARAARRARSAARGPAARRRARGGTWRAARCPRAARAAAGSRSAPRAGGSRGPRGSGPSATARRRSTLVAAMMRTSLVPRLALAHALERALLQHAQQLHLQVQRQVADLVEEERAAGGQLEAPRAVAHRAGEGARGRGRRARSRAGRPGSAPQLTATNGPAAPRRARVDRAGHDLLARAALAGQEDGRLAVLEVLDEAEDALHRRRAADEAGEGRAGRATWSSSAGRSTIT